MLKQGNTGQKVKDAQWLLIGHNIFKIATLHEVIDGHFGPNTAKACHDMKWRLGYATGNCDPTFGDDLYDYLVGHKHRNTAMIVRARNRRKVHSYPLGKHGTLIGWPGIGTHSWWYAPNNWESDNAVDIKIAQGTTVLAYADGTIGSSIGPLPSSASRFHGNRLHLITKDNEWYYAHLSTLNVKAGQHVKAGDILGKSGNANGVEHLHLGAKFGSPVILLRGL